MNTKDITIQEYADITGKKYTNLTKHIRNTGLKHFPEVRDIKYYSRFILLVVDADFGGTKTGKASS